MSDIDRLKNTVNIANLIGEKYPLYGQGRYLRAKEHDSLVIDTVKQAYFWNSRGEHGDIIDWIGSYELGYNSQWNSADPQLFKEAVIWLAKYAGQAEPQFKAEDTQARVQRFSCERLMALAADYYQFNLQSREIQGYDYALSRGFTPETIEKARLGYADGNLWRSIPDDDLSTATELGLVYQKYQKDNNSYQDSIPVGYLVYVHCHNGKIEYLTGRSITEKQHRNQRSPKKVFWATWVGYNTPLVICEGQADAISLAQLGVCALALCGVNLADFDQDLVKLFNPVYVWPDKDETKNNTMIKALAATLGPLARIIPIDELGGKDANDFLRIGGSPDDLTALIKSSPTFLDMEIDRLARLDGIGRYQELEQLFRYLAHLDQFALTSYRSRVTKSLEIGQADFGRYLRAAKGTLNDDEEAEFAKGGQYCIYDGWTVVKTFTDDGKPKIIPLANGTAKIVEEILRDDGSNDPEMDFLIAGELATGQRLPKIQIPAQDYASMKWIHRWGSRFILSAGRTSQDHFRAATQFLSGNPSPPYRRTIYTHTGWRKIDDQWYFLTSTGALGSTDDKIQVDLTMGRPDTNMTRYTLPRSPENVTHAMQASLNSWYICDFEITIALWAAMYLSPLLPFLTPDFGLWLHGQTGSMKSSIVATFLSHFGQWQGREAKIFLPSNFQSTSNSILMNAFQGKDVPLVVDDFAPGATQKEVRDRDNTASNLLRSVGNKSARGRMRDGRHFQADFPPRCLAIITAEDLPKTASIMARGIGISVSIPPLGNPDRRAIEGRLSQAQSVDSFLYPHAMAAYILWIQRHWDELAHDLPIMAAGYREKMRVSPHARLPDAFGKLMAAIDVAIYFAMDCSAITQSQADERKATSFDALSATISEHGQSVEAIDAAYLFRDGLQEQLDARDWWLCPIDETSIKPPDNYPIGVQLVGYQDDQFIYLLSKAVNEIMQLYQRLGTPFPVGRNTLMKRLIEKGWLIQGAKSTSVIHIPALGKSLRVLKLKKREVLEE